MVQGACFDNTVVLPDELEIYKCLKYKQVLPVAYGALTICNYMHLFVCCLFASPLGRAAGNKRNEISAIIQFIFYWGGTDNKSVNTYINKNPRE